MKTFEPVIKLWKDEETRILVDHAAATIIDNLKHTPTVLLQVLKRVIGQELQSR